MTRRHGKQGNRLSRRHWLTACGAGVALAPLLPQRAYSGESSGPPKRLLLVFTPGGTPNSTWQPQNSASGPVLQSLHQPLDSLRHQLTIPWGLRASVASLSDEQRLAGYDEHASGMVGLWTGATSPLIAAGAQRSDADAEAGTISPWSAGPSIDQIVAASFGPDQPYATAPDDPNQETPLRSLTLGVECGAAAPNTRMIYDADGQPIEPLTDGRVVAEQLFASLAAVPAQPSSVALLESASLDILRNELQSLQLRLGYQAMRQVEVHHEALSSSFRARVPEQVRGCSSPEFAASVDDPSIQPGYIEQADMMFELVSRVFACDLTRVASLQLSHGASTLVPDWAGGTLSIDELAHSDDPLAQSTLQRVARGFSAQVATLLRKLDSIEEGNGTVLDNTLVVWGSEIANAQHTFEPMPLILAGGLLNRELDARAFDVSGQPHTKLLVSVARAMGVELNGVGDVDPNSGPLPGL